MPEIYRNPPKKLPVAKAGTIQATYFFNVALDHNPKHKASIDGMCWSGRGDRSPPQKDSKEFMQLFCPSMREGTSPQVWPAHVTSRQSSRMG